MDIYEMAWLATLEEVSRILLEESNMTPERHARIMKAIREVKHD